MKPKGTKPHPGFPDYHVTENGKVWSSKRRGQWLRPATADRGRKVYGLFTTKGLQTFFAARLVLETYVGPRPPGLICCHKNGDRTDDRLENLYWGTYYENYVDSAGPAGVRGNKLNVLQVRIIHHLLESGELTQVAIGRFFGVSGVTVSNILHGRRWGTVTGRVSL